MMALLLVVCSMSGTDCHPIMAAGGLQQMECQVRGQQLAAQYLSEHPNQRLKGFKCVTEREVDFYLGRGQA